MSVDERLSYCQLIEQGIAERRAYAVSVTATRCGDGECTDFGVFAVTRGTTPEDDPIKAGKAASYVARTVSSEVMRHYYHYTLEEGTDEALPDVSEVLSSAINTANDQIKTELPDTRVGLTILTVIDNHLVLTNIGLGTVYLLTNDGIQRLTSDTPTHKSTLLGDPESNPQSDMVIKYLQPHAELLVTSLDVWGPDQLQSIMKENDKPGTICSAIKPTMPPENSPDLAIIAIKLGYLQR